MLTPVASIIIPHYNQARWLPEAIDSALRQTVPCEVIVVDDCSEDGHLLFESLLQRYGKDRPRLRYLQTLNHYGPSEARNLGISMSFGDFVMFLDADDVIAPTKVERQLQAFSDDVGWVMCDVRIEDEVRRRTENASDRYRYSKRELGGWIRNQLAESNFIPIMAPLVRRSVLADDIRFGDKDPEDWHFWYSVAGRARVRYLPEVLATYRKRRGSRSRTAPPAVPPPVGPVRLNLGCGTPGALSWHPMPGFVNLDRAMGWCFEDGLPQYADGAVSGITVSHALMYVDERDWPMVFAEFARVLEPGGVVRITEDETADPRSSRRGGWKGSEPAVTLTTPEFVAHRLKLAGLTVHHVDAETTHYRDGSLRQAQHGAPPDVFFIEGVKP